MELEINSIFLWRDIMNFGIFTAAVFISANLFGSSYTFKGSGTLKAVIDEVIKHNNLEDKVTYLGEGSSVGEKGILGKNQALAPMSRAFKKEALDKANELGIDVKENVIALDAVSVFVNVKNVTKEMDLEQVRNIFSCKVTDWSEVTNYNVSGKIQVFVRDSLSGTTETFKKLVGIKEFGFCVTILSTPEEMTSQTSTNSEAIGYSGRSSQSETNKALALSLENGKTAFEPTEENVQSFKYPLSRKLYVYSASGNVVPNEIEVSLLDTINNREVMDLIVEKFDFFKID